MTLPEIERGVLIVQDKLVQGRAHFGVMLLENFKPYDPCFGIQIDIGLETRNVHHSHVVQVIFHYSRLLWHLLTALTSVFSRWLINHRLKRGIRRIEDVTKRRKNEKPALREKYCLFELSKGVFPHWWIITKFFFVRNLASFLVKTPDGETGKNWDGLSLLVLAASITDTLNFNIEILKGKQKFWVLIFPSFSYFNCMRGLATLFLVNYIYLIFLACVSGI